MSISSIPVARVSNLMNSTLALNSIESTQKQLLTVQDELTTGKQINEPSDNPGNAAIVQQLQKTMDDRTSYSANLDNADSQLGQVDTTLANLTDLIQQAQNTASANVGSDVTADERSSASAVVQQLYTQLLSIGNQNFNGTYLFGGDNATNPPFVAEANGSVSFAGSSVALENTMDQNTVLPFQVNGSEIFGATSTRVQGNVDLTPALTGATLLSDLTGATNEGVAKGAIQIGNGTTTATVDLSSADSVQDVVNKINASGVAGVTASIGTSGLVISGGAGENVSVADLGGGTTAADLGILNASGAGVGTPITGAAVGPKLSVLTKLSDLKGGAGIDLSGLTFSNGSTTTAVSLAGATTVQDLLNAVNGSKAGVKAQINAAGTGIDMLNVSQGASMSIGENGGTTAADLGVRTMTATTALTDLNDGKGVTLGKGGGDLQITRRNGTTFKISLTGATTVGDVISDINAADAGGGLTASMATTGNGIVLKDTTGGAGQLSVESINFSNAAADLGLSATAVGSTVTGTDVNSVAADGIFAHVAQLRDALQDSDQTAITAAGTALAADLSRVVVARGTAGAQVQDVETRQTNIQDQNVATQALMSKLQDTDFTTAVTQFQMLQTSLQASYLATSKSLNESLMDFLST